MAYVDHVFHQKSKSTFFLQELLEKEFDITNFWINPWSKEKNVDFEILNTFDYVCFFQKISPIDDLRKIKAQIVWVQMYDSANFDYFYWKNLAFLPIKVLAFSKKIEVQCRAFGVETLSVQYYLDPKKHQTVLPSEGCHLFFWYRGALTWKTVRQILNPDQIDSLTYLSKPDPGYQREIIDQRDISRFKMRVIESEFLPTHDAYLQELSRTNIFIAPRKREGIGTSFLEALAKRLCVIANNDGTMNEYIENNRTGYLFNSDRPKMIDLSNRVIVTSNSYITAEDGYEKWLRTIPSIIRFIQSPGKPAKINKFEKNFFLILYKIKIILHPFKEKSVNRIRRLIKLR